MCAGCTSYHKTPVQEFEAHPEKFVNKNVRVHYDGAVDSTLSSGRTVRSRTHETRVVVPDSLVSLRVAAVDYPILTGTTISNAKIYGQTNPMLPVQVSLQGSRQVDVHGLDVGRTILLGLGAYLVAAVVYGLATW